MVVQYGYGPFGHGQGFHPWSGVGGFLGDVSSNTNREIADADNGAAVRNDAAQRRRNETSPGAAAGSKDGLQQPCAEHIGPNAVLDGGGSASVRPQSAHENLNVFGLGCGGEQRMGDGLQERKDSSPAAACAEDFGFHHYQDSQQARLLLQNEYLWKLLQSQNGSQGGLFGGPSVFERLFPARHATNSRPPFGQQDVSQAVCHDCGCPSSQSTSQPPPMWQSAGRSMDPEKHGRQGPVPVNSLFASSRAFQGESGHQSLERRSPKPWQHAQSKLGKESWRYLRKLMLRQQEQFVKQVWELHRVHWYQGYLTALNARNEKPRSKELHCGEEMRPKMKNTERQEVHQLHEHYNKNIYQSWPAVAGNAGSWGLPPAKEDEKASCPEQGCSGQHQSPSFGFPLQEAKVQFSVSGQHPSSQSKASGSDQAAASATLPPGAQKLAVDPHASWYAKHYGCTRDASWNVPVPGPAPQESRPWDQSKSQEASNVGTGVDWAGSNVPGSSGQAAEALIAAAAKAQHWWQDAARAIGNALANAPPVPLSNEKPTGEGHNGSVKGGNIQPNVCRHREQGRWACALLLCSLFVNLFYWLLTVGHFGIAVCGGSHSRISVTVSPVAQFGETMRHTAVALWEMRGQEPLCCSAVLRVYK